MRFLASLALRNVIRQKTHTAMTLTAIIFGVVGLILAGGWVNDIFVLEAWFKRHEVGDKIVPLADGNGDFARAMGMELDARAFGQGLRSQRYAAVIEDGVVKALNVDAPPEVARSGASVILQAL